MVNFAYLLNFMDLDLDLVLFCFDFFFFLPSSLRKD